MNEQRAPKFPATFCSQCGRGFGPGDHGFSHCEDHETKASKLIPHVHDEIPADIMKAATDIAYSAETGVVVGSFPGAVYIARAILAERQRFVAEFDGAADAGIDAAVAAERERCIEAARKAGNFGDYAYEELTADFGQPSYDMMNDIIAAIRGVHKCKVCHGSGKYLALMPESIAVFYGEETRQAVADGKPIKTWFRCDDCQGTGFVA